MNIVPHVSNLMSITTGQEPISFSEVLLRNLGTRHVEASGRETIRSVIIRSLLLLCYYVTDRHKAFCGLWE
jgi:hypothetical protein